MAGQYAEHVNLMANSGVTMFLHQLPNVNISEFQDQILIKNPYSTVTPTNYEITDHCKKTPRLCTMEDDYPKAEPLLLFLYLYGNWTKTESGEKLDKEGVWRRKTQFSSPSNFTFNKTKRIVYEKGLRFLTDELTKYLLLPYFDIPIAEAVFLNGERVRSHYSNMHNFPGMFAKALTYTEYDGNRQGKVSPSIIDSVKDHNLIMPYSAFAMLLHPQTRSYGVLWYANMLDSVVSQSTFGVLDSIKQTGWYRIFQH